MTSAPAHAQGNAAASLLARTATPDLGARIAVIDDAGATTYAALAERAARCAAALAGLGLAPGDRMVMVALDSVDFPTLFLGAIQAGVIPVPINPALTAADHAYILEDSGAVAIAAAAMLAEGLEPALTAAASLRVRISVGGPTAGWSDLSALIAAAEPAAGFHPAGDDDVAFWLYSSGSTGRPKGVTHRHGSLLRTAELYAEPVLGLAPGDVVYSASKLFFAYGLGNGMTFPFAAGATVVLAAERTTPALVKRVLETHRPTAFFGVPTLYAALLAGDALPPRAALRLRRCVSAGEALPEEIGRRWLERTGVDILDGIGSTEMLHIFITNRPGDVRYGSSGRPVDGYRVRLLDEAGAPVPRGEIGELQIAGPTAATGYWRNPEKQAQTFLGEWVRSGDKYVENEDGTFTYCGRSDDMLKVGGVYVSPFEVEGALVAHDAVQEAAVIGAADEHGLIKPRAYVVAKPGVEAGDALAEALKAFVKDRLAPYKYPRWITFVDELPKTATGKIQRFRLRAAAE